MAPLPLPVDGMVEVALGADLTAPEQTWTWTELTYSGDTRLKNQPVVINRGRADERGAIEPATCQMLLENSDGDLTPRRAQSTLYPNFRRGCPIRVSLTNVGVPHLNLTGAASSRAGTPDAASLDITGDWAIAVELEAPVYLPPVGAGYEVIGKFNVSGQRSVLFYWLSDGVPRLKWSTDGTVEQTRVCTTDIPRPIAGTVCVAVWLDVSNAGNHVVTFYAAPTLTALIASPSSYVLGTPVTTAGTTSVFASTAPLDIGDVTGSGFSPYVGKVRKAQVRAGDFATGTIQAQPDFTAQAAGATSFSDGIRTWTITSPAAIERKQTRFLGQITDIKPTWEIGDVDGTVRAKVEASGVLQRLQRNEEPIESALYRRITSPQLTANVIAYWPHEDGADATQLASPTPGVSPMQLSGEFSAAADDTLSSSKPLLTVASGDNTFFTADIPQIPQVPGVLWEVTRFFKIETLAVSPADTQLMAVDTTGRVATWRVFINDAQITVTGLDVDDTGVVLSTLSIAGDNRLTNTWVIARLSVADDGANVDWEAVLIPIPAGVGFGQSGTFVGNTGVPLKFRNSLTGPAGGPVSVGHLVVTTGTALNWLAPADTGFAGETAAARIQRLCDEQAIPVTIRGDTSEAMGPQRPLKLTELLAECAAADLGVLAELPNTVGIGYRCRSDLLNQAASFTVDADLNLDVPFEAVEDDQRIVNDITAARTDGSLYRAVDDAHIAAEDRYRGSAEVNVQNDWQLVDYAGRRLHAGTWPEMRYPAVPVNLVADSTMHDPWLLADLGDVFNVTGLPGEHPTPSVDLVLEGYAESITADSWDLTLDNGPAGPLVAGVVEDDVLGRAGTDGSQLDAAISTSATSFDVAVTAGELWITDPAEFPFDAVAAGEEWTVTDIDASLVTFGATGTASHANNANVTPGAPASISAGNLLLVFAAIRNSGAGVPDTPAGYTRLPVFPSDANAQVFAKIAVGGDTAPTISFTGGVANADTSAQMIRLAGKWHDPANIAVAYGSTLNPSAQDISYPATRIVTDNCIVLYLGWKQDDWTSVAAIGGATEIGEPSTTTGDDQGIVWDYVIQTTAADIPPGTFTVTGGASAISRGAVIALRCDKQTWTVTRSANGVTKSHPAGTAVQLADPMIAA